MTLVWRYPLYLIPLEGGYVSVLDQQAGAPGPQHLAVFTEAKLVESFMQYCQIPGDPRQLGNAREFGWLLQSLRHPVTHVAFDPQPDARSLVSRWNVPVAELLAHHLVPDNSPWNYPVFVLCREHGYASIEGRSPDGSTWTAINVFSSRDKAETYSRAEGIDDTIREITDMAQARELLQSMGDRTTAVAFDPTIEDGRHAAAHCFAIKTVLDKYLVRRK